MIDGMLVFAGAVYLLIKCINKEMDLNGSSTSFTVLGALGMVIPVGLQWLATHF